MTQLINIGGTVGIGAAVDKQLRRFQIADGRTDPQLSRKLADTDPGLLNYLATRLADAIFNAP